MFIPKETLPRFASFQFGASAPLLINNKLITMVVTRLGVASLDELQPCSNPTDPVYGNFMHEWQKANGNSQ